MGRRVFAQMRKELIQILRDRLALTLALLLPVILLLLMSYSLSLTVSDLPLVVQDFDNTTSSRAFTDAFRQSISFHVVPWPTDRSTEAALRTGKARAVLIIPVHFARDLARGVRAQTQLVVDGSDANTAKLVKGYASQIAEAFVTANHGNADTQPVTAQIRLWFNPGRSSPKFYAPGIFVLGISMFPPLLASIAMAKEGEQKTILQVYVSNISAHEFLLGKIAAFMLIALGEWLVSLTVMLNVFGLHFAGDPSAFIVASLLYFFCVASFGSLIGAAIPSQAAAIQVISLGGFLLVFLLSGLIYPVANIPAGLRWVTNLVWGRYYIEIVRDALLQGGGWKAMTFNVVMIAAIGTVFYILAWRTLRGMQVQA